MSQYDALLDQAERKHGLPSGLLHGLMQTESAGNPNAVSKAGAIGLMQFMPATAKQFGIDPRDPAQAIDAAGRYMAANLKAANGNVSEALRFYQGGPSKTNRGPENAAYAGKVLSAMPGDSGDLAAMGFNKPSADAPDLSSAGLSATPDADVKKARDELDAISTVQPAADKMTSAVNGIIDQGLKAKASREDIKNAVYAWQSANGIDPTKTKGIDDYIDYRQNGGTGAAPVLNTVKVIPLTRTQKALAGLKQGVEDVDATLDPIARAVANHDGGATDWINNKLGLATSADATDFHARDRALFNGALGDSTLASMGRIGGNVLTAAPLIMSGNALAARAAAALPEAAAPATAFLAGEGGGNLLQRGASMAAHGAAEGAMGAAAVSGGNDVPLGEQMEMGALGGSLLGPAGGVLAHGGRMAVNAVAPTIDPIIARLAQRAVGDYGIGVRGSQVSNSPFVRTIDSVLARVPGSGMAADNEAQRDAFTRAVGDTFGAGAHRLTPEVMQAAKARIGSTLDTIANRTRIVGDDQLIDDLGRIESEAPQALTDSESKPVLNQINNILAKLDEQGHIDGETYQNLTRKGAPLDVAMSNHDSNISHYASQVRDALDDALERSASPDDLEGLRVARFAYKNMKTVEPLAAKSQDGTISPALLQNRVVQNFKNFAYDGGGPLGDLAKIGQRFLKDQGSSNTAERSHAVNMLMNIAKVGGGAAATLLGVKAGLSPAEIGSVVGTGAGTLVLGRAAGSALRSDAYRNRLLSAALDNDQTGGVIAPWLAQNFTPLAVAGGNRLLTSSAPSQR